MMQKLAKKYKRQIRFVISGSIVAFVALVSLYVLTDVLGLWYLLSSVVSFFIAITVNFLLQQYWTFDDAQSGSMTSRAGLFFGTALLNLFLNTTCMYVLVDMLHVWHILSQTLIILSLSIMNYLIYRYYIFKPRIVDAHEQ